MGMPAEGESAASGNAEPTSHPFAPGSVSLGLHPLSRHDARAQAAELLGQAAAAEAAGFDGVTLSEHHAGFPGYMPQPLLAVQWILEATTSVWSGPAPTILGLRQPRLLAEELAWTHARFPRRVGAAFVPGYARSDFDALGVDFEERHPRFQAGLAELLAALQPHGPLGADPAISALSMTAGCLLVGANSKAGVHRAASLGLGVLFPGGEAADRLAGLGRAYREQGGRHALVCVAVVSLTSARMPAGGVAPSSVFVRAAAPGMRQAAGFARGPFSGSSRSVADQLGEHLQRAGATAVNVRIGGYDDASAGVVVDQIRAVGEVLDVVRDALSVA
jgi:alkanesulfonate monooxygenase SsuD/methylene tetrahydromethanopterin reductase-like flavin-dependent oxidoreductase (luciferase family)